MKQRYFPEKEDPAHVKLRPEGSSDWPLVHTVLEESHECYLIVSTHSSHFRQRQNQSHRQNK